MRRKSLNKNALMGIGAFLFLGEITQGESPTALAKMEGTTGSLTE